MVNSIGRIKKKVIIISIIDYTQRIFNNLTIELNNS